MALARERNGCFGNNRGVALLAVLMVISLLAAVLYAVNQKARTHADSVMLFRDTVTLSHVAASGINIGMAVLIDDRQNSGIDSIQEQWADPDKLAAVVSQYPFEKGRLSIHITDILSRVQVNALVVYPDGKQVNGDQEALWFRMIQLAKMAGGEKYDDIRPVAVVHAIKDWLDFGDDDATEDFGAESDYYQGLVPPYSCRNGPIIDVCELALVKGMSAGIFKAVNSSYNIEDVVTAFGMVEAKSGHGYTFPGRININTAPVYLLSALMPTVEDAYLGAEIDAYRREMSNNLYTHDLVNPEWYKDVPGCSDITIPKALVTTSSDFFQIDATASLDGIKVSKQAVVKRVIDENTGKWFCRVLKWRTL